MVWHDDDGIPNEYLLDEIRLNRAAIEKVGDTVSGKVGRGELVAWLTATSLVLAAGLTFTSG